MSRPYSITFEVALLNSGVTFCKKFPLGLYVIWVTGRRSYLGTHFRVLREASYSADRVSLETPLGLATVHRSRGFKEFIMCLDISLGHFPFDHALQDLLHFFECQVGRISVG